jgi:SnoaL-like domain
MKRSLASSSSVHALALAVSMLAAAPWVSADSGVPVPVSHLEVARGRTTISDGERALAMWQVQNTMSRHEYYHAAIRNLEEIDAYWVSRDGPYATSATFSSPGWVMNGIETIRRAYGQQSRSDAEKALEALNKVDPGVKVTAQNYGAGSEWVMHTSTTPVIEIAGDGQTAKGVWYSPGVGLMGHTSKGKIGISGSFFYEKYAGDFVKENGIWKIWHLQMAYDFVPGLPQNMIDAITKELGESGTLLTDASGREAGERSKDMPPGFTKPVYSYPAYAPRRPGIIYPQLPEPYYTFSETFNYCNCDAQSAKPYPRQ